MNDKDSQPNEYHITVRPRGLILNYQIIDKSTRPSKIHIITEFLMKIVFIEKTQTFEIYSRPGPGLAFLRLRIQWQGSKKLPLFYKHVYEEPVEQIRLSNIVRTRPSLSHGQTPEDVDKAYDVLKNAVTSSNALCLCPTGVRPIEGYFTLAMGTGLDHLIIADDLISRATDRSISVKLIKDKVSANKFGWNLKIRKSNDIEGTQEPRRDVLLVGIEIVRKQNGQILFDLTDRNALTGEVDLIRKANSFRRFTFKENINVVDEGELDTLSLTSGADGDDYLYLDPVPLPTGLNYAGKQITVDLGQGTNVVIIDVEKVQKKLTELSATLVYSLRSKTFDGDSGTFLRLGYTHGSSMTWTDVLYVDKVVCQFPGGYQRDAPIFLQEGRGIDRNPIDDCNDVDKSDMEGGATPGNLDCSTECR